jgi:hypothetical protein
MADSLIIVCKDPKFDGTSILPQEVYTEDMLMPNVNNTLFPALELLVICGLCVMFDIIQTNRISRMTCFGVLECLLYSYDYGSKLSLVMDTYTSLALVLLMFQV